MDFTYPYFVLKFCFLLCLEPRGRGEEIIKGGHYLVGVNMFCTVIFVTASYLLSRMFETLGTTEPDTCFNSLFKIICTVLIIIS